MIIYKFCLTFLPIKLFSTSSKIFIFIYFFKSEFQEISLILSNLRQYWLTDDLKPLSQNDL
jgi:hypothetical protein